MAEKLDNKLYGIDLPQPEAIKKLAKDNASFCDANLNRIAEIDKEVKAIAKESKTANAKAKKELSERKVSLVKEKELCLIKAKVNESNSDAYADIYKKVTGTALENLRKTDRINDYKKLSAAEIKETVIKLWGGKKPAAKKPAEKKPAEKKTVAKKTVEKKAVAKKTEKKAEKKPVAAKKATAKKAASKKTAPKKTAKKAEKEPVVVEVSEPNVYQSYRTVYGKTKSYKAADKVVDKAVEQVKEPEVPVTEVKKKKEHKFPGAVVAVILLAALGFALLYTFVI